MLIDQPFNGQLGEIIKEKLHSPYVKFTIVSAFAKNSGVLRLKPALERFRKDGGKIEAFIGVDADGTSYEAVLNLFGSCDDVYIVHSESAATTFHSKIYMLSGEAGERWLAVGSNNLTGGGLWSNFESAICFETNRGDEQVCAVEAMLARYRDPENACSLHLNSLEDIERLSGVYLRREAELRPDSHSASGEKDSPVSGQKTRLFGSHGEVYLPALPGDGGTVRVADAAERALPVAGDFGRGECMWFETRSLTGGSRNILDLSKLGKILSGSAKGTRYETARPDYALGGVSFFGMDPERTAAEKEITVNYNGTDYFGNTIKFPAGALSNGSWRIQLKGESAKGEKIQAVGGFGWLRFKVVVFEKIGSDYYAMSVLEESSLLELRAKSKFVASNGSAPKSKQYGLF